MLVLVMTVAGASTAAEIPYHSRTGAMVIATPLP